MYIYIYHYCPRKAGTQKKKSHEDVIFRDKVCSQSGIIGMDIKAGLWRWWHGWLEIARIISLNPIYSPSDNQINTSASVMHLITHFMTNNTLCCRHGNKWIFPNYFPPPAFLLRRIWFSTNYKLKEDGLGSWKTWNTLENTQKLRVFLPGCVIKSSMVNLCCCAAQAFLYFKP